MSILDLKKHIYNIYKKRKDKTKMCSNKIIIIIIIIILLDYLLYCYNLLLIIINNHIIRIFT